MGELTCNVPGFHVDVLYPLPDHLKTVPMGGERCLMVDGRNETKVTCIKAAVSPAITFLPQRSRHDSSSSTDTYLSSTAGYYDHENMSSSSVYPRNEGVSSSMIGSISNSERCAKGSQWYSQHQAVVTSSPVLPGSHGVLYHQQPSQTYDDTLSAYISRDYFPSPSPSNLVFAGNMPLATPVYIPPLPQSPMYSNAMLLTYPGFHSSTVIAAPSIQPEARKIIITQLPPGISSGQLQQLLYKYIDRSKARSSENSPQDELHDLVIVPHTNRRPRSHAFATLGSEQIAHYLVKSLNGYRFQGREIKARFAKEGVNSSTQHSSASTSLFLASPYQTFESTPTSPTSTENDRLAVQEAPSPSIVKNFESRSIQESKDQPRNRDWKDSSKKKDTSPLVVNGSSFESESSSKNRCNC